MKLKSRRGLILVFGFGGVLVSALSALLFVSVTQIPSYKQVRGSHQSSELLVLDDQGRGLQSLRTDYSKRQFFWVDYSEISPSFISNLLRAEDRRFFSHPGFDPISVVSSFWGYLNGEPLRGASTLSMQLIKLLHPDLKTYQLRGKIHQTVLSLALELRWKKNQILEAYSNLVSFRGELQGIEAVSNILFSKSPRGLSDQESVVLVTLIRAPNMSKELWTQRACRHAPSDCAALVALIEGLQYQHNRNENIAFEFASLLRRHQLKGVVRSFIDRDLQTFLRESAEEYLRYLENENVSEVAIVVLENKTGHIKAYLGNRGEKTRQKHVDGAQALRQAGSTLKPFLYALAMDKTYISSNSWIEDSAVEISFDRGVYKPRNHDHRFYGWVQAKMALASSLNVPAVKVMQMLPEDSLRNAMEALGFRSLRSADFYGPALALGVADIALIDLTNAYRSFANGGLYSPAQIYEDSTEKAAQRVFSEKTASEISHILRENSYRTLGFGLNSVLSMANASVKTGTSKDMRDNWCVGFDSHYTVGVWVGNFDGSPMRNVVGTSGAAPLWVRTMNWLQERSPVQEDFLDKVEAEPLLARSQPLRIAYPPAGLVIAIDPEVPTEQQKIPLLMTSDYHENLVWNINGNEKLKADENALWSPKLGRNTISLESAAGVIESVEVIVR